MKTEQIKDRGVYEISVGKTPTGEIKKTIVKVVQWNPKAKSWLCKTEAGRGRQADAGAGNLRNGARKRLLQPNGLIHTIGDLKIGVWIMPDNNTPGMAEDLFLTFLPDKLKPQRVFAERTLDQLESENLHRYKPDRRRSKALTHTVLAWQAEPDARMGEAIRDNYVTLPTEKLPFVDWLSRLFS